LSKILKCIPYWNFLLLEADRWTHIPFGFFAVAASRVGSDWTQGRG